MMNLAETPITRHFLEVLATLEVQACRIRDDRNRVHHDWEGGQNWANVAAHAVQLRESLTLALGKHPEPISGQIEEVQTK